MLRPITYLLLLASCLLAAAFPGRAQGFPLDPATGTIYYSEEVPVTDGPKTDLFYRARTWLLAAKPGRQALQVADVANGVLIARTYSLLPAATGRPGEAIKLWHTIKIEVEDDRFWYSLSDFELQWAPAVSPSPKKQSCTSPLEDLVIARPGAAKPGRSGGG